MILDRAELIAEAVRTGTLAGLPGGHFIDGRFVESASGRRMESFDPGRGKAFATVAKCRPGITTRSPVMARSRRSCC